MTPGRHNLPAAEYHALRDIFSRSTGHTLIERTPLHVAEPEEDDDSGAMDIGTAIHEILLGRGAGIVEVDAKDWRTKAAKEARQAAREAGQVALLAHDAKAAASAAAIAWRYIEAVPDLARAFEAGAAEQTLIWDAGGVRNRALVDWLPADPKAALVDIKTTEGAVNPRGFGRKAASLGYDMQAAHYLEGARALGAAPPAFLFLLIEQKAPHACCVMGAHDSLLELGRRRLDRARTIWRECMATGSWPGFPPLVHWAEAPAWALMEDEEEEMRRASVSPAELARWAKLAGQIGGPVA